MTTGSLQDIAQFRSSHRRDISGFKSLVDEPILLNVEPLVMPANGRLAISHDQGLTAGDITIEIGGRQEFGHPDLAADEIFRGIWAEEGMTVVPVGLTTGVLSIYYVNPLDGTHRLIATSDGDLVAFFNFDGTEELDAEVVFNRDSVAYTLNDFILFEPVAIDVPRFPPDPYVDFSKGLLIEPSGTNLLVRSEEVQAAGWSGVRLDPTESNAAVAPDGMMSGDAIIANNTNGIHFLRQSLAKPPEQIVYAGSCFIKQYTAGVTTPFAYITLYDGSSGEIGGRVNLVTGAVDQLIQSGAFVRLAFFVLPGPLGWWRVAVAGLSTTTLIVALTVFVGNDGQATYVSSYVGDQAYNRVLVWGAMLEGGQSVITDDFDRADEELDADAQWTKVGTGTSHITVAGNELTFDNNSNENSPAYVCSNLGTPDHYAQVTVGTGGEIDSTAALVCVRVTDPDDYLGIRYRGAGDGGEGWEGLMNVGGLIAGITETDSSATPVIAAGQVVRLEAVGNQCRGYVDDVLVLSWGIDPDLPLSNRAGFVMRGSIEEVAKADNFEAQAVNPIDGSFNSTYIKTGAVIATRHPETAVVDLTGLLGADNTIRIAAHTYFPVGRVLCQLDDGTEDNRVRIERDTNGEVHVIVTAGGVEQADLDLGAVAVLSSFIVTVRFGEDDFAASLDGGAVVADVSGTMPTVDTMRIGHDTTNNQWGSIIKSVELWDVGQDDEFLMS